MVASMVTQTTTRRRQRAQVGGLLPQDRQAGLVDEGPAAQVDAACCPRAPAQAAARGQGERGCRPARPRRVSVVDQARAPRAGGAVPHAAPAARAPRPGTRPARPARAVPPVSRIDSIGVRTRARTLARVWRTSRSSGTSASRRTASMRSSPRRGRGRALATSAAAVLDLLGRGLVAAVGLARWPRSAPPRRAGWCARRPPRRPAARRRWCAGGRCRCTTRQAGSGALVAAGVLVAEQRLVDQRRREQRPRIDPVGCQLGQQLAHVVDARGHRQHRGALRPRRPAAPGDRRPRPDSAWTIWPSSS